MNGGFFWQESHQSSNYEWQGGFLHENHTFISLTPTMLLKMLYKIRPVWTGCRPVQDRGLLLVRSLPVAVWSFGQCRTGPSPFLCLQEQKTGLDQTFKHYIYARLVISGGCGKKNYGIPTTLASTGIISFYKLN